MISNDERREVAARLRNYKNLRESFRESPICAFNDALGVGYIDWKGVCDRLADLIEPEPERTCHKNPPDALVVYKGDEVIGTFDSYEQAAEFLGVKVSSVKFMASPTYQRRKGSERPTGRTRVERVYFEEGEEW